MRPATSLARWLLAVCAETPARAASSPAGLASPPARARQIVARVGSARRPATNAILASISEPSIAPSGAWMFHGRSNPNVGPRGPGLPSPEARGVAGAHDLELGGGWRRRLPAAGRDSKVPPRRGPDGLHALPRVP